MTNKALIEDLREVFVSMDVFNLRMTPIEKIVYGGVTFILLAVIGALVYGVVHQPPAIPSIK